MQATRKNTHDRGKSNIFDITEQFQGNCHVYKGIAEGILGHICHFLGMWMFENVKGWLGASKTKTSYKKISGWKQFM